MFNIKLNRNSDEMANKKLYELNLENISWILPFSNYFMKWVWLYDFHSKKMNIKCIKTNQMHYFINNRHLL